MSKCERKVVRKFALETEKLMHSLYPTDRTNKMERVVSIHWKLSSMNLEHVTWSHRIWRDLWATWFDATKEEICARRFEVKQHIYLYLGGKVAVIQQGTNVWVGSASPTRRGARTHRKVMSWKSLFVDVPSNIQSQLGWLKLMVDKDEIGNIITWSK